MHGAHLLENFLLIVGSSVGVVWLFHKLRLPPIIGFLAVGVLIGPGGFGWIQGGEEIELLAEIGVVLLLFSIGLEISIRDLWRIRRLVFGGGGLQMLLTGALGAGAAWMAGFSGAIVAFWGAVVSLSSTAIVLNLLQKSGELGAVHGQGMLGILIFQDLAVVVLILLVPILGGASPGGFVLAGALLRALVVVVGLAVAASYLYPWAIERIVATRQRELFTLFTVLVAVGTAYVAGLAGVSLPLGAFLAGLVISESPYSHHMLSEVLPFRDLFNSLFFVSVGLLFEPGVFSEFPLALAALTGGVLLVKALVVVGVMSLLGYGIRPAILVGLGLAQVGEFAFVLAREGFAAGLVTPDQYSMFIGVALGTMALTPMLFRLADWVAGQLEGLGGGLADERLRRGDEESVGEGEGRLEQHVIVIGYGLNGRNVARVLRSIGVPYVVVELNSKTVAEFRDEEHIYYGDATRQPILEHLGIDRARALVAAIGDASNTRRIVAQARELREDLEIIVRTRYVGEVDELYQLGASVVVPEEYETALALVGSVLETYGTSPRDILREKDGIRRDSYELLRRRDLPDEASQISLDELAGRLESDVIRVSPDAAVRGSTLEELNLHNRLGIELAGVFRDGEFSSNPPNDWRIRAGDELVVLGTSDRLVALHEWFRERR